MGVVGAGLISSVRLEGHCTGGRCRRALPTAVQIIAPCSMHAAPRTGAMPRRMPMQCTLGAAAAGARLRSSPISVKSA